MVALKMGTGLTMVIAEQAWRRLKAENARLRSDIKQDNELIAGLRAELRAAHATIDSQRERLVDLLAEREECIERVTAMSKQITRRTAA